MRGDPHRADRTARRSTPRAYGLVCVTSPNAPRLLLERCGGDARALAGVTVAAIGPGTAAALREVGIVADVVAERFVAEGLLEALPADLRGARALVARAEEARDTLPEGLRAAGAEVDVVPLYRTLAARAAASRAHARRPMPSRSRRRPPSRASPRRSRAATSRACAASRSAR